METLPKEQLLLKLLKMTTSSNDGECLVAIRKVNTLLTQNGWDWDKLIAGKIKIVENPFVGLGTPQRVDRTTPMQAAPTPPSPRATAVFSGQAVRSMGINKYADNCYCCGIEVIAQAGGFFVPSDYNLNARPRNSSSKFAVVCKTCDGKARVWDQAAAPLKQRGKTSINDLA